MSEQWYCSIEGKETGPLSAQQLKAIATNGRLSPDDLVRAGISGGWVPAKRVKGLFSDGGQAGHESDSSVRPPALPPMANVAPPPPPQTPPHQVTPPPVASPSTHELPPRTEDFPFLGEVGIRKPQVGAGASVPEPSRPRKDHRRRQLFLVWALLVTFLVLCVAVVYVSIAMNQPLPVPEQVATRPPATPAQDAVKGDVAGRDSKAPLTPGGKHSGPASPPAKPEVPPSPAPGGKPIALAAKSAAKPPAAQKGDTHWVNAKESAATLGDIRVRINSAVLGRPKDWVIPPRIGKSTQFLILTIELSNSTKNRKIDHTGWAVRTAAGMGVKLTDEVPNHYALKAGAIGQGGSEPIYPGQSVEDKLIFERPIDAAKVLRLQLPAAAFGGKGTVQFEIPKEMIVQSTEQPEPSETPKPEGKPAKPRPGKADEQQQRTGDPMLDFGLGEGDNRMRRPPAKRPVSKDEVTKTDQDRQTKKSGKSAQPELKEKAADREGGKRGPGFDGANKDQSPF